MQLLIEIVYQWLKNVIGARYEQQWALTNEDKIQVTEEIHK